MVSSGLFVMIDGTRLKLTWSADSWATSMVSVTRCCIGVTVIPQIYISVFFLFVVFNFHFFGRPRKCVNNDISLNKNVQGFNFSPPTKINEQ